jgi:hypothetical protein
MYMLINMLNGRKVEFLKGILPYIGIQIIKT